MRVVSFVPGATALACRLGLGSSLVGVTHECAASSGMALDARVLTRSRVPTAGSSAVIDGAVRTAATNRNEVQVVDAAGLATLAADVVIVPPERPSPPSACAASPAEVTRALATLPAPPRILAYGPETLPEVFGSARALGEALGVGTEAARLVAELRARVDAVRALVSAAPKRPRTALLSWIAPPVGSGGLLAQLVRLGGGLAVAGDVAERSRSLDWPQLCALRPDVLILAPCGFTIERARAEADALRSVSGVSDMPAVRWGQVHVVDGLRHFSAPGAESVRALEILAALIHPELPWPEGALAGVARPVAVD